MPGLYRKKCKDCQHDNHFNSNKCVNDVEVRWISKTKGEILPVRAMHGYGRAIECQLFM